MIQLILCASLIWLLFKLVDRKEGMDFYLSLGFYVLPLIIVSIFGFVISFMQWSPLLILPFYLLYLVIPYLMINHMTDYTKTKKWACSGAVFFIVVLVEGISVVLLNPPSA